MRWATLLAWTLLAGTGFAGDWKKEVSPPAPGAFPARHAFSAKYTFGWGGLSAADATLAFTDKRGGLRQLDANLSTTGMVRSLFSLDVQHRAQSSAATLQPVTVRQCEKYKNETIKSAVSFSPEGVTRQRSSSIPTPGNGKKKHFKYAPSFDLFSAYLWLRSQPLKPKSISRLVVYQTTDPYLVEFQVVGRSPLVVGGRSHPAIQVEVKLQEITKSLDLTKVGKFKHASAWISDDADRRLLRVEAEVFIGNVWLQIQPGSIR